MSKRIAYLAPVDAPTGTFGYEAVRAWLPDGKYVPYPSHHRVLEAVENGNIPMGIIAVENSIDGPVTDVLDFLIHDARKIRVCGEVVVTVNQCLWSRPGIVLEDVEVVISHPKGLGQCARNIHRIFPEAQQMNVESTAAAVLRMLESDVPAVAIAGKTAVQDGAVILQENFQDRENNSTLFWVVGRHGTQPTGQDKTSLCVIPSENKSGTLFWILGEFARLDIDLTKQESRPTGEALGKYVFLIDLEGHQEDPKVQEALDGVRRQGHILRIFGSYPRRQNS